MKKTLPTVIEHTKKQVDIWIRDRIVFDPLTESAMQTLFADFSQYHEVHFKSIPIKPRIFASSMKQILRPQLEERVVRFEYRKSSRVLGVRLRDTPITAKQSI